MKLDWMLFSARLIVCAGLVAGCERLTPLPATATPSASPEALATSTSVPATPAATATPSPIPATPTPAPPAFLNGIDASYLQQIEDAGGKYYEKGEAKDALTIYKNHGVNTIRLRLWVAPIIGYNDLNHTLKMAKRVKALGMGLMIDFHYSDTWADPGKQYKPAAWANLSGEALEKAVRDYTRQVITALKKQGTLPDLVQIGNEITPGMLWEDGRVNEANEANWPQFAALLKAGVAGVQDSLSAGEQVQIVLHVDAGGNNATCRWFFDHIVQQQVPFDVIGLSYYPWWHGSLTDLQNNLDDLAGRYHKPLMVVETAYPWSLENNDTMGNLVGPQQDLLPDFPPTVEGQGRFLQTEKDILKRVPDGLGKGMFYWAADDITSPRFGSVFENAATFDFRGNVLESLDVFLTP
jgi:arabinogalactan endo-1,4-beta-galactosidase